MLSNHKRDINRISEDICNQIIFAKKMEEKTTHKNTALLVMDVQAVIVSMLKESSETFLDALAKTIQAARNKNIAVIYVVVGFRRGYPEVSPANKSFSLIRDSGRNMDTEEATRPAPKIAPIEGDIIITKKRVSAFTGSDLEVVLRANGIQHLVLTGIATSGVVLSTLREAADKDYRITVLSDCCADADAEVHHVLTTKVFPRQADVLTRRQWMADL
jgi:nicotinamidase-related amidase